MISPYRVLARIILLACALAGFLVLLGLELVILGAGSAESVTTTVRCLIAPASSLDTVVHASAVAIGLLTALPIMRAARTASHTRATVDELRYAARTARLTTLPSRVVTAATKTGVLGRLDVVDTPGAFAFAYGWVRPRICLSTGLVALLTDEELEAVLLHEGWHMHRRDPLWLLLVQVVGAAFVFVPEIRRLVHLYRLAVEVAADRHVVAAMGDRRWLASALVKVMGPPVMAPAFEGQSAARIAALSGAVPAIPRWRGRLAAVMLTLEIIALVPLLTNGSLVSLAGFWIHPVC